MIQDGTAIGLGLANAVNRLKDSPGKSKVVILLTDGINNQGAIAPVTAAELAKASRYPGTDHRSRNRWRSSLSCTHSLRRAIAEYARGNRRRGITTDC